MFYQLQNRCQQWRRKILELTYFSNLAMTAVSSSNVAVEIGLKKAGDIILQKIRISKCSLCHFSIVVLDVSLGSTGVISYKFSKAPEMSFHLVHSHFSVLNR